MFCQMALVLDVEFRLAPSVDFKLFPIPASNSGQQPYRYDSQECEPSDAALSVRHDYQGYGYGADGTSDIAAYLEDALPMLTMSSIDSVAFFFRLFI